MRKNLHDDATTSKVRDHFRRRYHIQIIVKEFLWIAVSTGFSGHAVSNENMNNGYEVYMSSCIVCHGDDGTAQMPGVPDLNTNTDWSEKTRESLVEWVKLGSQGSDVLIPMPPKGGNPDLSDSDINDVLQYMKNTFRQ